MLIEYRWDPKTERATEVREVRGELVTNERPAPLPVPEGDALRASYNAALLFWLRTQT